MSTAYHMPETMSLADRLADINTRYVSRMRIPDEPTSHSPTDASANNSKQPHSLNPLDPRSAAEEAEEVSRGGGVAAGEDTDELHSIAERPYNGDKFSTRGEYTSALVYLSRMKVSSHVDVKGVCCMHDLRLGRADGWQAALRARHREHIDNGQTYRRRPHGDSCRDYYHAAVEICGHECRAVRERSCTLKITR